MSIFEPINRFYFLLYNLIYYEKQREGEIDCNLDVLVIFNEGA